MEPATCAKTAEEVAVPDPGEFNLGDLPLRSPDNFIAGELHNHIEQWEAIVGHGDKNVLDWLRNGVKVTTLFCRFKGNFQGRCFDSKTPPPTSLYNSKNCMKYVDFISNTLEERIVNGSIEVLGRVGEVPPPRIVMPLTVEPTKPRLCHDERFLNLWIKDLPFSLETLKDVPRLISAGDFLTSCDEKSGYDHV